MNPYGDTIQEHFRHPRNYGSVDAPDIRSEDVNPFCGDRVRIEIKVGPDSEVSEVKFQGDLCVIAKAASSILTEMIAGLPVERAGEVSEAQLIEALHSDIRPARRKCALLPLTVLQSGVNAWTRGRTP
ncbi:MAG TPA: iron-sulfur cluster assembly scaffold protein [Thermoanaerobaculia bacterium]|nr:iron-sulfur cluster assembly scaffold protein [Thermoanaerobaculia bacterium]